MDKVWILVESPQQNIASRSELSEDQALELYDIVKDWEMVLRWATVMGTRYEFKAIVKAALLGINPTQLLGYLDKEKNPHTDRALLGVSKEAKAWESFSKLLFISD